MENQNNIEKKEYFPLFLETTGKKAIVFGAGKIGKRRINTLLQFNFQVTVVDPDLSLDLPCNIIHDVFKEEYIDDQFLVVASTNNREVNKKIGEIAKRKNIFVSVADRADECTFLFPAICTNDKIVAGITSEGKDHSLVRKIAKDVREVLADES